jgi:hypothetical protein
MTFSAVLGRENGPGGLENSRENKVWNSTPFSD